MSTDECTPISEWPPPEEDDINEKEVCIVVPENISVKVERCKRKSVEEEPVCLYKKKMTEEAPPESVEVTLARWYRQYGNDLRAKYPGLLPNPGQASPKTVLALAANTKEGRTMLQSKLKEEQKSGNKNSFGHHFQVASMLDRLGEKEAALSSNWTALAIAGVDSRQLKSLPAKKYLDVVASLDEEKRTALWLQYRLQHELSLTQGKEKLEMDAFDQSGLKVQAHAFEDVSKEMFLQQYCSARVPLLMSEVPSPTHRPWTLEYIKNLAKECTVQLRTPVTGSTEWAGLENGEQVKVGDLLSNGFPPAGKYLFDWSLPLHCPALSKEFTVPELFQDNYLKQTSPSALYHQSWPSLFIAGAGTNGELHIDAFGSHFWMFMISGRKRWTFYPKEQV